MKDSMQDFARSGIDEEMATRIIQYLRDWVDQQDLRVSPNAELYRRYGIVDEDLDEFVLFLADASGRTHPGDTSYWPNPIRTLQDLSKFVLTFPTKATLRK